MVPEPPKKNDKSARKAAKRAQKLVADDARAMRPAERMRTMWEILDQSRRLNEMADRKARYALVVSGAVNAGLYLVAFRSGHIVDFWPAVLRPWLAILVVPYAALLVAFLVSAYHSLLPRPPSAADFAEAVAGAPPDRRPRGLIFWPLVERYDIPGYQKAWREVTPGELNEELAALAKVLLSVGAARFSALARLYRTLLYMILLAAGFLVLDGIFFLLRQ